MHYFLIYFSGVIVCNVVLDTLTLLNGYKIKKPTALGVAGIVFNISEFNTYIAQKWRVANTICSLLFSWMWAVGAICILVIMVLFGRK